MKFTVEKDILLKALQLTSKAISTRPIIPLASSIHLEVNDKQAVLSSTNFEIGIKTVIAISKSDGKIDTAVPGKLITDFINILDNEPINLSFSEKENILSVKTKNNKTNIKCTPADEFPVIASLEKKSITIDSTLFKQMINCVSFSAATDTNRNLDGVLLEVIDNKLTLSAADGFRLSYDETTIKKTSLTFKAIIRATTLDSIADMIDSESEIKISCTDGQLQLQFNGTNITVQTMNNSLPDFNSVKPNKANTSIVLSTKELLFACKQLEIFSSDSGLVRLSYSKDVVSLNIAENEKGDSNISLDVTGKGNDITLGLNIFFLHQFLNVCDSEQIVIDFISDTMPVLLQMKDTSTYYHIVMPMSIPS